MKKIITYSLALLSPFLLLFIIMNISLDSSQLKNYPIKSDKEYVLVYFGFPGCSTTCPSTLKTLAETFNELAPTNIEVHFINISHNTTHTSTEAYAKAFHPSFKGFTLPSDIEKQVFNEFNIQKIPQFDPMAQHLNYNFLLKSDKNSQWQLIKAFPDTINASDYLKKEF